MSKSCLVELTLPKDMKSFRLPPAVQARLQDLLDRQDEGHKLTAAERREAEGLASMVDMLSLLRLRAERAARRSEKK
jgi:hypothetical protein